jgi:MFS family permease
MRESRTLTPDDRSSAKVPGSAWYALAVLIGIYTINAVDRGVMSVLMEPIKKAFQLNDAQAGALNTITHSVGLAIGTIPLGLLADRVNRVRLIGTLTSIWSTLTLICGAVPSALWMVFARTGVGIAESGFSPSALSLVTDLFPKRTRSTAIGFLYVSTAMGTGAIFLVGGYVAAHYGWRAGFLIAGIPGLLLTVLLLATVREPMRGRFDTPVVATDMPPRRASLGLAARAIWHDPAILCGILGTILGVMAVASVLAWGVSFFVRAHGLTLPEAGLALAITAGPIQGAASALMGAVTDRIAAGHPHRIGVVPAVAMVLGVPSGLLMLYSPGAFAIVGLMLFGATMGAWLAQAFATILACAEPHIRGGVIGIVQLFVNLFGAGGGPWLAGMISTHLGDDAHSLRIALTFTLLLSLPAAALLATAARHAAPRLGRPPLVTE